MWDTDSRTVIPAGSFRRNQKQKTSEIFIQLRPKIVFEKPQENLILIFHLPAKFS